MKRAFGRFGFTLVEVNLAIFVMAVGVLSMCALYGFGYRENRQSEEDVFATAYADAYLAPLVAALSSPQLDWNDWKGIGDAASSAAQESGIDACWPANGWRGYINGNVYRVKSNPKGIASGVINQLKGKLGSYGVSISEPSLPKGYQCGLVVTRRGSVVQLAFRMSRRTQTLLSQPVFVAEVRFQGGFKQGAVK